MNFYGEFLWQCVISSHSSIRQSVLLFTLGTAKFLDIYNLHHVRARLYGEDVLPRLSYIITSPLSGSCIVLPTTAVKTYLDPDMRTGKFPGPQSPEVSPGRNPGELRKPIRTCLFSLPTVVSARGIEPLRRDEPVWGLSAPCDA